MPAHMRGAIVALLWVAVGAHGHVDAHSHTHAPHVPAHVGEHQCIHDKIAEAADAPKVNPQSKHGGHQKQTSGLRIEVEYIAGYEPCTSAGQQIDHITGCGVSLGQWPCIDEDVMTGDKDASIKSIIDDAVAFWDDALALVPLEELAIEPGLCCSVDVPASVSTDADFKLFVTFHPINSLDALGWAIECRVDDNGRPIAGMANFAPNAIPGVTASPLARNKALITVIHEIAHALGFSGRVFSSFLDRETGNPYTNGTIQTLGNGRQGVTTPAVLQVVRDHFGCDTLDGAEIENQGGGGTAGSHWEKRIFANDMMTGSGGMDGIITPLTLAMFEDSGWYTVTATIDHPMVEPLVFGDNMGCVFATNSCHTWGQEAEDRGFFCDNTPSAARCSYDRRAKGYCAVSEWEDSGGVSTIPEEYQYFVDPSQGGARLLADYCPRVIAYENRFCSETTWDDMSSMNAAMGEITGESSMCFTSSVRPAGSTTYGSVIRCHQHLCTVTETGRILRVYFDVDQTLYLDCTEDMADPVLPLSDVDAGWIGELTCPTGKDLQTICGGWASASITPSNSDSNSLTTSSSPSRTPSRSVTSSPTPSLSLGASPSSWPSASMSRAVPHEDDDTVFGPVTMPMLVGGVVVILAGMGIWSVRNQGRVKQVTAAAATAAEKSFRRNQDKAKQRRKERGEKSRSERNQGSSRGPREVRPPPQQPQGRRNPKATNAYDLSSASATTTSSYGDDRMKSMKAKKDRTAKLRAARQAN